MAYTSWSLKAQQSLRVEARAQLRDPRRARAAPTPTILELAVARAHEVVPDDDITPPCMYVPYAYGRSPGRLSAQPPDLRAGGLPSLAPRPHRTAPAEGAAASSSGRFGPTAGSPVCWLVKKKIRMWAMGIEPMLLRTSAFNAPCIPVML